MKPQKIMNLTQLNLKFRRATLILLASLAGIAIYFNELKVRRLEENSFLWTQLLVVMRECHTGIILVEAGSSNIAKANEEAESLFGYSSGEMSGLPVSELVADQFLEKHTKAYSESLERSAAHTVKTRAIPVLCSGKRKDGTLVPCVIRLYIGDHGTIALINLNSESKYLPIPH